MSSDRPHSSDSPLSVVVLAAGQGKRMRSHLPKVLHELAGKPLLGWVLDTALTLSPERVVVVYGHGGDAVPNAFGDRRVTWVLQDSQLGTGHAVAQTLPCLPSRGTVLVLYGDVPLLAAETLRELVLASAGSRIGLLTQTVEDPTGYGRIVRDSRGAVIGIREQKDAGPAELAVREVNTGIMALPAVWLEEWLNQLDSNNAQNEYYLTDVVALAVAQGIPVVTVQPVRPWEALGVNSKKQLAELERHHQLELADALLDSGVTLRDPARIDIRGNLRCGRDVVIDVGCIFEGDVVLEDGVVIGPYCCIKNSHIGPRSQVLAYSHLEGARLGASNRIGPYTRVRPETVTGSSVHLGNFVEVKQSELGDETKANHLAYIGDASVGSRVNVGAGTITCNYDGANKHRTVIEDDVFIGSDTQLVAPVTVGRGATIGAGSTIVTPAPAEQLTVSRARQVTIPRWKRPVKKKAD